MVNWLAESFLQWLACVLVVAPFIGIAVWQGRKNGSLISLRPLAGLAIFFYIALALARSSRAINLIAPPWQGMLLEGIFAISVIFLTRSGYSSGLTFNISRKAWRDVIIASILLLSFVAIRSLSLQYFGFTSSTRNFGFEYLLFQLTLPGITEELVYRGVIQSRLNRMLSRPWKLWRAPFGWGLLISSILFWAIHAFQVNGWEVAFHWQTLTLPLIVGFVLGWMRERSKSIVPSVIAHNLVNVLATIL